MEIIISLILVVLIGSFIQFVLWKSRRKNKNELDQVWNDFLEAFSKSEIDNINKYGHKLIWNKHLKQEQLSKISEVVESYIDEHPELEKLKLNAYNKQLHYNRALPY